MPEPKTSPRWFHAADSKRLVLLDSAGREWDVFAPPDALAFFANRFEAKAGQVTLTFYYRDPPTRDTGFALWHEGCGVFLGEALGLGFWSKMDPAGQELAVTWPTEREALDSAAAESLNVSGTPVIAVPVVPDWLGDLASIRACARAQMEPWDPDVTSGPSPGLRLPVKPQDPEAGPETQPQQTVGPKFRVRYAEELGTYKLYRKPVKTRRVGMQELMPGQGEDGYGKKITTDMVLVFDGDVVIHRVYATCINNAASHWILTRDDKFHLRDTDRVDDVPIVATAKPAPARREVVIDVYGGVVQAVFGEDVDVILVDWDNIKAGDTAIYFPVSPWERMSRETREQVDKLRQPPAT